MSLVRLGYREYVTADGRFHVMWHERQGARSCYTVLDRETDRTQRAFNLNEVRETIADMRRSPATDRSM